MSFEQHASQFPQQPAGQDKREPLKTTDAWYWLSQKLEGDWPAWRGESLTRELLESLAQSWTALDVNLKLKLLLALIALKRSVATQLEDPIRNLFDLALQDQSDWVRVISTLFAHFLEGQVDLQEYQASNSLLADTITRLQSVLNEVELTMVPKERAFLQSEKGQPIQPKVTHFTLKASARSSKKVELASATKVNNFATKMQQNHVQSNHAPSPLSLRTSAVDGRFHMATSSTSNIEKTGTKLQTVSLNKANGGTRILGKDEMDVEEKPRIVNSKLSLTSPKSSAVIPTSSNTASASQPSQPQKEAVGQSLFNRTKKRERPAGQTHTLSTSSSSLSHHSSSGSMSSSGGISSGASQLHGSGGGQTAFIEYFEPKKETKTAETEKTESNKRRKQTTTTEKKKPPPITGAPLRISQGSIQQPQPHTQTKPPVQSLLAPSPFTTTYPFTMAHLQPREEAQPSNSALPTPSTTNVPTYPQPYPSLFPQQQQQAPTPSDVSKPTTSTQQAPLSSLQQLQVLMMMRNAPTGPAPSPLSGSGPSAQSVLPGSAVVTGPSVVPPSIGLSATPPSPLASNPTASTTPANSLSQSHQQMMQLIQQQQQIMQQEMQARALQQQQAQRQSNPPPNQPPLLPLFQSTPPVSTQPQQPSVLAPHLLFQQQQLLQQQLRAQQQQQGSNPLASINFGTPSMVPQQSAQQNSNANPLLASLSQRLSAHLDNV